MTVRAIATKDAIPGTQVLTTCSTVWNGTSHDRPVAASASPTGGAGVPVVATGLGAWQSLSSAIGVGPGSQLDGGVCRSSSILVVTSGAGVSAGAVQLQGSLDGTSWYNIGSPVSTTTASTVFTPVTSATIPVRMVRAAITTAITGGSISAMVGMA